MKVTGQVKINSNITYVVNKFLDNDFVREYDNLVTKYEVVEGKFGEQGSIVKYTRDFGSRLLIEEAEVISENLPEKIVIKRTMIGAKRIEENTFKAIGGETLWEQTTEFKYSPVMHLFVKLFQQKALKEDSIARMNKFKDAVLRNNN